MSTDLSTITDLETILKDRNEGQTSQDTQWLLLYDPTLDVCWVDPPKVSLSGYRAWTPNYSTTLTRSLQQQYFPTQPNLVGKTVWMNKELVTTPLRHVSFASIQGPRPYQEDRLDYRRRGQWTAAAVYDGHGGAQVSEFLREQLLPRLLSVVQDVNPTNEAVIKARIENLWLQVGQEIFKVPSIHSGSTAIVLLTSGDIAYLINLGDSRGVIQTTTSLISSRDDKPDRPDEIKRIEAAGGTVTRYNGVRVNGVLATSRAFGDPQVAKDEKGELSGRGPVTVIPTIQMVKLNATENPVAVLGTDGVWDVIKNGDLRTLNLFANPGGPAKAIVDEADKRGSRDNISAIFMILY